MKRFFISGLLLASLVGCSPSPAAKKAQVKKDAKVAAEAFAEAMENIGPAPKHPTNKGTEAEAWKFCQTQLAGKCKVKDHAAKYENGWIVTGKCDTTGDDGKTYPAKFDCRFYFGKDNAWHLEMCGISPTNELPTTEQ